MLARVAENLYWLGRFLERAENTARLCDVTRLSVSEHATEGDPWSTVLSTLSAEEDYAKAREKDMDLSPEEFIVGSPDSIVSIRAVITQARNLAMELREFVSREVFEEINRVYRPTVSNSDLLTAETTQSIRRSVATVYGMYENTVLQSEGAHWFRFGQLLERADMTSRLVDAKYYLLLPTAEDVGGAIDRAQWRGLLLSASGLEAYRRRFHGSITVARVIDLLFFDERFPRSLVHCVKEMQQEFNEATVDATPERTLATAKELAMTLLELRALRGQVVVKSGLHDFIDGFQEWLGQVHNYLVRDLFRAVPEGEKKSGATKLASTHSLQSE